MGLIDALNRIDRRYGWSLFGFVLGAIFGGITIYTEFIRDNRPDLRFEVISDASVLDVKEPLGDLQIVYGGVDITKAKQSLRVLVVRVSNVGLGDILRSDYDDRSPVGFKLTNGTLLRVEVLSASNDYIRQTLAVSTVDPHSAVFNPIIVESQEWFVFKCLILYSDVTRPSIEPTGKVARVRTIKLIDVSESTQQPKFWSRTLAGSIWTQLTRAGIYGAAFTIYLLALLILGLFISDRAGKRGRRRQIVQFKAITTRQLDHRDEFIFDYYLNHDLDILRLLNGRLKDPDGVQLAMEHLEKHASGTESERPDPFLSAFLERDPSVRELKTSGIVKREGNRWKIDEHVHQTLDEFLKFVQPKKSAEGPRVQGGPTLPLP